MNKVILIGVVGKEIETQIVNGTPVAKFPLATSEKWTDKQGNKQEKTEWHNIEVWGKGANTLQTYSGKGKRLFIEGKVSYGSYEKNGEKKYFTSIKCLNFNIIDFKENNSPSESVNYHDDLPF